jgi:hypothetical protein
VRSRVNVSDSPIDPVRLEALIDFYLLAKGVVVGEGFGDEITWQGQIQFSRVDESIFLREAAWVVLSCGMRETVVRRKFQAISLAFYNWLSARHIRTNARQCRRGAFRVFGHLGKINSIIEIARSIDKAGFDTFKRKVQTDGILFLQSLPYVGPATSYHLAKNVGLDVVKPDRHLVRISALMGYADPAELCRAISTAVGDRVSVVDVVVWRYATLNPGYRDFIVRYIH